MKPGGRLDTHAWHPASALDDLAALSPAAIGCLLIALLLIYL